MKYLFTLTIAIIFMHCSAHAQGWVPVGTGSNALNANNSIWSICSDNGILYAGGQFKNAAGNYYVAKWNGSYWEELGGGDAGLYGNIPTDPLYVDNNHNVYTVKLNALNKWCVMKWNGAIWTEVGTGSSALNPEGTIFTICTDENGYIYAAGDFDDGLGNIYVAKWNGTSWSQLGTGSNALNASDDINVLATDSHGNMYAAGSFTSIGSAYVAKWNGTEWHHLGAASFLNAGNITDLYIDIYDNVYAVGSIWNIESRPYVAKWDGVSWNELGSGSNSLNAEPISDIQTITGDQAGNIYAAGSGIRQSDGKWCVKRWNGVNWSEVGTGGSSLNANTTIWDICIDTAGSLYAAGGFTDGATPDDGYHYVAKFAKPTAVKDIALMGPIQAWPNPAHNVLNIKGDKSDEYYYIYDMAGCLKSTVHSRASTHIQAIDVSALSVGLYLLQNQDRQPFIFTKN